MVQRPSIIEVTNNLALAAEDLRSSCGVPEFEARNTVIKEYNAATVLRNNKKSQDFRSEQHERSACIVVFACYVCQSSSVTWFEGSMASRTCSSMAKHHQPLVILA